MILCQFTIITEKTLINNRAVREERTGVQVMARPSRNSIVMTVIILPSSANNVRFTYPGEAKHRANTIYNA